MAKRVYPSVEHQADLWSPTWCGTSRTDLTLSERCVSERSQDLASLLDEVDRSHPSRLILGQRKRTINRDVNRDRCLDFGALAHGL